MKRGSVFKRCSGCGDRMTERVCKCGSKSHSWGFRVDTNAPGETRNQVRRGGFKTKAEAVEALNEVLGDLQRQTFVTPSKLTLREYLRDRWLPAITTTIRSGTLVSYRGHVEHHIAKRLGSKLLQGVTAADINALYADLLKDGRADDRSGGLSPATVRRVHATLHRAFKDAVKWGLLVRNPADTADPPKANAGDEEKSEMATWSADELKTFLAGVADDRLYSLWLLYGTTGMRRGEALGLRPEDIDFDKGRAEVRQTVIAVSYVTKIGKPKSKKSRRSIPLDKGTVAALRTWRKQQAKERLAWGPGYQDCGLFFTREDGSAIHPDRVSKMFDKHVKRLGLPRIRLHDLRHTFCTLALRAGVHPKVVSEIAGHTTVSITLDIYSHAIPSMQEDAAALVAGLLSHRQGAT